MIDSDEVIAQRARISSETVQESKSEINRTAETDYRGFAPACLSPEELAALFLTENTDLNVNQILKSNTSVETEQIVENLQRMPSLTVKIPTPDFDEEYFLQMLTIGVPVKKYSRKGKVLKRFLHYDSERRIIYWNDARKKRSLRIPFLNFRSIQEPLPLESLRAIRLAAYLPLYGMFCPAEDASRSVSMIFSSRTVDLTFATEKIAEDIVAGILELRRIVGATDDFMMTRLTRRDKSTFADFHVDPGFPTG